MKKFLSLLLSFTLAVGTCMFASCGIKEKPSDSGYGNSQDTASQKQTYTVTFKQHNQPDIVKTVEEGDMLTDIPSVADRVGYTTAWDTTVDLTRITKNLVVNAIEIPNIYTITYDANGGAMMDSTKKVTYDSPYTLAEPYLEDYIFQGWTYEGNAIVSGDKWTIAQDVTLLATWKDNRPTFTVTFVDGNAVKEVSVKKGESVSQADVPAFVGHYGHTAYWDITDYTNIQADMTVTAVYVPNKYTITYEADGFDIDGTTLELTFGADCTDLDMSLTKEGYNFLGWDYNGVTYTNTSKWNVAEGVILTAVWAEKEQVVVTFKDTDGSSITKMGYEGESLKDVPTPTAKTGYNVDTENWYADEDCTTVASFDNLQATTTVYAKAVAKTYNIQYNVNGGILDNLTQEVTFDTEYTLATPTHEKSYMRFDGWFDANDNKIAQSGVWATDSGISLKAKWTDTRPVYTVSFQQNNQPVHTFDVKEGEALNEVPTPVAKIGYVISWDTENVDLTNVQSDLTIYAKETAKTYTLILTSDENGEIRQASITVTYDKAYDLSSLTQATKGYKLDRWERNGQPFATTGTWTFDEQNVTVKAIHVKKVFTIYLNVNGGNALETTTYTVTYGETYSLPVPTRKSVGDTDYNFHSWRLNSAKGTKVQTSGVWSYDSTGEEITLYAKWDDGYTNNY